MPLFFYIHTNTHTRAHTHTHTHTYTRARNFSSTLDWEPRLREEIETRLPGVPNPLDGQDHCWLSVREKAMLLRLLCDWRFEEASDAQSGQPLHACIKELADDQLRIEPLGTDAHGNSYWYFCGVRLYKEEALLPAKPSASSSKRRKAAAAKATLATSFEGQMQDPVRGSWSLACDSVEDWNALIRRIKVKRSKSDAYELYRTLREDMLPGIEEMWAEEQRARRKRELYAALPRRASSRQEALALKRLEQERIAELRRLEEEEKRERRAREKAQREEQKRLRARRERQERREAERAARRQAREMRGELWDDSWCNEARSVLAELGKHRDGWLFADPVDEAVAPGYYEIIENPMDLKTVGENLTEGMYATKEDMARDIYVMLENCRQYNAGTEYVLLANALEAYFNKRMQRHFRNWDPAALCLAAGQTPEKPDSVGGMENVEETEAVGARVESTTEESVPQTAEMTRNDMANLPAHDKEVQVEGDESAYASLKFTSVSTSAPVPAPASVPVPAPTCEVEATKGEDSSATEAMDTKMSPPSSSPRGALAAEEAPSLPAEEIVMPDENASVTVTSPIAEVPLSHTITMGTSASLGDVPTPIVRDQTAAAPAVATPVPPPQAAAAAAAATTAISLETTFKTATAVEAAVDNTNTRDTAEVLDPPPQAKENIHAAASSSTNSLASVPCSAASNTNVMTMTAAANVDFQDLSSSQGVAVKRTCDGLDETVNALSDARSKRPCSSVVSTSQSELPPPVPTP